MQIGEEEQTWIVVPDEEPAQTPVREPVTEPDAVPA
jgi:hypothetical protein